MREDLAHTQLTRIAFAIGVNRLSCEEVHVTLLQQIARHRKEGLIPRRLTYRPLGQHSESRARQQQSRDVRASRGQMRLDGAPPARPLKWNVRALTKKSGVPAAPAECLADDINFDSAVIEPREKLFG
jgi:hypothetical protein